MDNAVKFMGEQTEPRIDIGAERHDGRSTYFVRDNGIGIDPAYRSVIFDLFHRLDPAVEGTDIGLSLVRRIVEAHGGRVWVESAGAGTGATFRFVLPAPQANPGAEP